MLSPFHFASPSKKRSLDSFSVEQIRKERIALEQAEARIMRDIDDIEEQKSELFQKGAQVSSDRQKIQLARKIKELDGLVRSRDKQLQVIGKNMRVITGFTQMKENQALLRKLGMLDLVNKTDLTELQRMVEQSAVDGQFQIDKLAEISASMEQMENSLESDSKDEETLAIVEAMNRAAEVSLTRYDVDTESKATEPCDLKVGAAQS
ncbi:MAG: hypothetical protein AAGJ46_12780 [Planctomycetota bacterium]